MPTTTEIKNAIKNIHATAGASLTAFLHARDYSLANHTAYPAAIKDWKTARADLKNAQEVTHAWVEELAGSTEWMQWFAPYVANDQAIRTQLDDSLNALLADLASHAKIQVRTQSGETITRAPSISAQSSGSTTPTLTQHPDGSATVDEGGESVTVTADGEVETGVGTAWWLALAGAASYFLYRVFVRRS